EHTKEMSMNAETSSARGEWVLVPRELLDEARNIAMEWTLKGRVPECGQFGQIAQALDAMLATAPPPDTERGEWPARYMANGPQGTFCTDDLNLADELLHAYGEDEDWTMTYMLNPTGTLTAP